MFRVIRERLRLVKDLVRDERGAALWEYALLVIVGLGIAAALFALRDRIRQVLTEARQDLTW